MSVRCEVHIIFNIYFSHTFRRLISRTVLQKMCWNVFHVISVAIIAILVGIPSCTAWCYSHKPFPTNIGKVHWHNIASRTDNNVNRSLIRNGILICRFEHCHLVCVGLLFFAHTCHYNDVTMDSLASQITSLTIVYSAVYSGADQRKHQSSASRAFVRVIPRTNGQLRGKCFHLMTSSCVWIITTFGATNDDHYKNDNISVSV